MNGKKDSVEINIQAFIAGRKQPEPGNISKISFSGKRWISSMSDFCREDTSRVFFSVKVGLAVLLDSLLILFQGPYHVFGTSSIWSIITVVMIFEYSVGATLNRGFNRALGTLLAVALAISFAEIALRSGPVGGPVVIGSSIFLLGIMTAFMKIWPSLVPYEYGFRVVLFTYCLIILSGYRMGKPIMISMERLYSIAIGAIVAVLVNVLVCPVWAGEHLHKELASRFTIVADLLEECVRNYLQEGQSYLKFTRTATDEFPDEPAYMRCRAALNTPEKIESLANSAKWEPPHGRFCHVFYPWSEYVKVHAVLRYCAYEVMALHGVLHAEVQAPYYLRIAFQKEIQEAAADAAEIVRALGKGISNMQQSLNGCNVARVHTSTERLQRAIDKHQYLLIAPSDEICHNNSLKNQQRFSRILSSDLPKLSYHGMIRKKQRRVYSWPSRESLEHQTMAFESNAALLSLATFVSLLVELVARLDHLVDAVDKLSRIAKFKPEVL